MTPLIDAVTTAIADRTMEVDNVAEFGLPLADARRCAIAALKAVNAYLWTKVTPTTQEYCAAIEEIEEQLRAAE